MNKIRVIDLLNKIANGEEVPKRIKYNDVIYWYDETDDNEIARYVDIHNEWLFGDAYLNDEIEIIEDILEEEKKIPEKLELIENGDFVKIPDNRDLMNKINEIIDYLKSKGE